MRSCALWAGVSCRRWRGPRRWAPEPTLFRRPRPEGRAAFRRAAMQAGLLVRPTSSSRLDGDPHRHAARRSPAATLPLAVVQEDGQRLIAWCGRAWGRRSYADLVLSLAGSPGSGRCRTGSCEMLACEAGGPKRRHPEPGRRTTKKLRRLEFKGAVLTEVTLPALARRQWQGGVLLQPPVSARSARTRSRAAGRRSNMPRRQGEAPPVLELPPHHEGLRRDQGHAGGEP